MRQLPTAVGEMRVELEWNPFSAASRAARAERAGRYAEALRHYASDRDGERRLVACLAHGLPPWPIRDTLLAAARELLHLERGVAVAQRAGAPAALASSIWSYAEAAAALVWRSADRLAAVSAQNVDAAQLQQALGREHERLAALRDVVASLRTELAAMTLSGTPASTDRSEERRVQAQVLALVDVARTLRESADEA
jgi:hypothetical protein